MPNPTKVLIKLQHVANAPILATENRVVTINEEEPLAKVTAWLRTKLGEPQSTPLFVYVKKFAPCPQEKVGVLSDSFGSVENGVKTLTVFYALNEAWG